MTKIIVNGFEQFCADYWEVVDSAYYLFEDELSDTVDELFGSSSDIEDTQTIVIDDEMTVENEAVTFTFVLLLDDDRQPYIMYRGYQ